MEQSLIGDREPENIGDPIHEIFSQYGDGSSTFSVTCLFVKNERITFNGENSKMKVDYKENITDRYPGEVYRGICRCVMWRSITGTSVGIQYSGRYAHISGGK